MFFSGLGFLGAQHTAPDHVGAAGGGRGMCKQRVDVSAWNEMVTIVGL